MKGISREFKIGFTGLLILGFFVWGYSFLSGTQFFGPSKKIFYTSFKDVSGLRMDAPVLIYGLNVGKVKSINLQTKNKGALKVAFSVRTDLKFSKKSKVFIRSVGLMAGNGLVIEPVYGEDVALSGSFLESGASQNFIAEIKSQVLPLKEKAVYTLDHLNALMKNLFNITNENNAKHLNATLHHLEKTTNTAHEMLTKNAELLNKTLKNLERISDTLARANMGFTIKKITKTSENLEKITEQIQKGQGTFGKLIHNDSLYTNLNKTLIEMQKLFKELKENPKRFVHFSIFGKKNTKPKN